MYDITINGKMYSFETEEERRKFIEKMTKERKIDIYFLQEW